MSSTQVDAKSDLVSVTFTLHPDEETAKVFAFNWELNYVVSLQSKDMLRCQLEVINKGDSEFSFTTALHTYFKVKDIANVSVSNVGKLKYIGKNLKCKIFFLQKNFTSKIQSNNKSITDKVRESKTFDEDSNIFTFGGEEVDRAYISCPDMLDISQPNLSSYVSLSKNGFPECVLWSIGSQKAPTIGDLANWREYVCAEAAVIAVPVILKRDQNWKGYIEIQLKERQKTNL